MVFVSGARAASRHDSRCHRAKSHESESPDTERSGDEADGSTCFTLHQPAPNGLVRAGVASLVLLAAGALLGCSEGNADPLGAAGGGTAGSAGTSGGQTGSSGTGGSSSTAGTSGGGTSGGGGSGPLVVPILEYDFADDIEGWVFVYAVPDTLIAPATAAGDAGAAAPPPAGVATAVHDTTGDPMGNPGSVRLELPFSAPMQKITFEANVAMDNMGIDLAGRSVSARISVVSGYSTDAMNPPGLKLYVKTGASSLYADSGYINITPSPDWTTFTWANVSNPQYTDPMGTHAPTDVRQIGIEFDTGDGGAYLPATLLLDSVSVY